MIKTTTNATKKNKVLKTKQCIIIGVVALLLSATSTKADAIWGATGHRVVGEIAQGHLKSSTKRKIKKLLNGQSLAYISTFADEKKSDERYKNFTTWHYINMPLAENYNPENRNPDGDLVSAIEFCSAIISDENSSDSNKIFYLKLFVHFIGDLHQPMHIGLEADKGGNDFKLKWFGKDSNLHKVWDSEMIESYNMSYTELATNSKILTKVQIKLIQQGTLIDWVNDIHKSTRFVYNSTTAGENLSYRYSYLHFDLLQQQLQYAGIRLAKVLNDLF